MPTFKTAADFKAFTDAVATVHEARRQALQRVFAGTELKPAHLRAATHAKGIKTQAQAVRSQATSIASEVKKAAADAIRAQVRQQVMKLLVEMFGAESVNEVMAFLTIEVLNDIADLVAEVTPYLGIAASGGYVVVDLFKVGSRGVTLIQIERARSSFAPGDPQAALRALEKLVKVEMGRAGVDLAADAAALGGKVGGLFVDFGAVTGAAAGLLRAVVKLVQRVMVAALDYRDMVAGNRRLADHASLDGTAFEECPLLACYFLTCASDSDLLAFLSMEIGTTGFVAKVETLKRKIGSARDSAASAIDSSRFVLYRGGAEVIPQGMENGMVARKKRQAVRYAVNFKRQVLAALPGRG